MYPESLLRRKEKGLFARLSCRNVLIAAPQVQVFIGEVTPTLLLGATQLAHTETPLKRVTQDKTLHYTTQMHGRFSE
jgi:hypothetical protein